MKHVYQPLCYQVMLKFHERLITPFLLGSLSVRLNNLACEFAYRVISLIYDLGTLTTYFAITVYRCLEIGGPLFFSVL